MRTLIKCLVLATLLASGCQSPRPSVSAQMEYRCKPTLADSGEVVAGVSASWN